MKLIVIATLSLIVGLGIVWAGERDPPPSSYGTLWQEMNSGHFYAGKDHIFKVTWNEKDQYLEVIGKNIHLRIHKCGRVEKLEWKEINKNEEQENIRIIGGHSLPYYQPKFDYLIPSR